MAVILLKHIINMPQFAHWHSTYFEVSMQQTNQLHSLYNLFFVY